MADWRSYFGPSIARRCEDLRNLVLTLCPDDILYVLRVLGPMLESLDALVGDAATLQLLPSLCPKLTCIKNRAPKYSDDRGRAYIEVLCASGSQLRFASLDSISPVLVRQVVTACPNLICGRSY